MILLSMFRLLPETLPGLIAYRMTVRSDIQSDTPVSR
jgi:hypothetical protein